MMTEELFRNDSYLRSISAKVTQINELGGIILDRTVFYPTGGGQPGDKGMIIFPNQTITIVTTVKDRETGALVHIPAEGSSLPKVGDDCTLELDWDNRYRLMRMHTALHLLCSIIPFGVTGGQIGPEKSRLDFDLSTSDQAMTDKDEINARLKALIAEDHALSIHWVDDNLLEKKPDMVRTMSVKPPKNASGLLRLVQIGEGNTPVDLQPCGGTHVAKTGEILAVQVGKIENKGARNRRINLVLK